MGNCIPCTLSAQGSKHSKAIKVILPGGEIHRFHGPVKAAELMLETPNFFVANTRSLQIGRRFSPLNADEELELANAYVMFPMKRLNSVVTAGDMGALLLSANAEAKRVSRGRKIRILPENCDAEEKFMDDWKRNVAEETAALPKLNLEDIEEFSGQGLMHRLSFRRSKKPLLETIAEEPVCSR